MKSIITFFCIFSLALCLKSQTAMDFNMSDCSGNMHHLYTDYLDNEEVVIIEFFMTCTSCIETGQRLTPMYNQLAIDYPGQVNFFAFNFLDDLDCSVATNFVTTFGINAVPFDSGEAQLNYYYDGVFGMPNVVIVAGSEHQILYQSRDGIDANDTIAMDSVIRSFFTTMGTEDHLDMELNVYPNPSTDFVQIDFNNLDGSGYILTVENLNGQKVKEIDIQGGNKGVTQYNLPTFDIANGVYLLKLEIKGKYIYRKININH